VIRLVQSQLKLELELFKSIHVVTCQLHIEEDFALSDLLTYSSEFRARARAGITLFNALPPNIKQAAHDTNQFEHKLKMFPIDNASYSVESIFI
jgi:hypothetical protein